MSPRKSPIKHKVTPKNARFKVKSFKRGKGNRRKEPRRISNTSKDSGFNVSFFFGDKPRETVNVGENNYTAGVRAGLSAMRTPAVPVRVQIRRRKR